MGHLTFPDILPYLLAILGLLLLWQLYDIQAKAGRIQKVDVWGRSGIRFFLHMHVYDPQACAACRAAGATAYLPTVVAAKRVSSRVAGCSNATGCRCLLVGLDGKWQAAQRLYAKLSSAGGKVVVSADEVKQLLDGAQAVRKGLGGDLVSACLLSAMHAETDRPEFAVEQYRTVIEQAKTERDLPLLLPAYVRAIELLEQIDRRDQALALVERFLQTFGAPAANRLAGLATPPQDLLSSMSLRRTRLTAALSR